MSRVYVGRINHRCDERDLERFFRSFGRIREVVLKNGYGFVEFDKHRDADDAVHELNGSDFRGDRIIVEHAKAPTGRDFGSRDGNSNRSFTRGYGGRKPFRESRYGPPTRTDHRVIVENLSSRVSWQDLKDTMRKVGEVSYADAHRHTKREGIVEFHSKEDMKAAIDKFDGYELKGRRLKVFEDKSTKKKRSSTRSRSASPSRKRSRRSYSSRSRSRDRSVSRRRSESRDGSKRERSKSRDRSRERSKSRDRSVSRRSRSRSVSRRDSRSRSHSNRSAYSKRSTSPRKNGKDSRSRSPSTRRNDSRDSRSPSRDRSRSISNRD